MERNTAVSPRLQLTIDKIVDGGVGGVTTNNPLWLKAERE
jgi:hypothetical protein